MSSVMRGEAAADYHDAVAAEVLAIGRAIHSLLVARRPGYRTARIRLNPILWADVIERFRLNRAEVWGAQPHLWRVELTRLARLEEVLRPVEVGPERLLSIHDDAAEAAQQRARPFPGRPRAGEDYSVVVSRTYPFRLSYSERSALCNITVGVQCRNWAGAVTGPNQ